MTFATLKFMVSSARRSRLSVKLAKFLLRAMVLIFQLSLFPMRNKSPAHSLTITLLNNYEKLGGTVSSTTVEVIYASSLVKSLIIAKNFEVQKKV
jgi:hypothetical protein